MRWRQRPGRLLKEFQPPPPASKPNLSCVLGLKSVIVSDPLLSGAMNANTSPSELLPPVSGGCAWLVLFKVSNPSGPSPPA